jgi:hypothetical protein
MQLTLFTTHKTCTQCGEIKPLTDYHAQKTSRDGLRHHCKKCQNAATRARYEANPERERARSRERYEANRERARANNRAWREANRERKRDTDRAWREANRERKRDTNRAWREANPERTRAQIRAWREANPERYLATSRAWAKANPERTRNIKSRRRARKAAAVPQRWRRNECPNHLCYWCGTTLTPDTTHLDHIMPLSLGGPHTPDNTANTCAPCNLAKNNKHPLVWIAQLVTEN